MTPPYSATDLTLIIGVVTTSAVTIINAIAGARGRTVLKTKADDAAFAAKRAEGAINDHAAVADSKLDHITTLANGNLAAALTRIAELEALLKALQGHQP